MDGNEDDDGKEIRNSVSKTIAQKTLIHLCLDFAFGDYVLVLYRNKKYPGVKQDFDRYAKEYQISVMEKNKKENWT